MHFTKWCFIHGGYVRWMARVLLEQRMHYSDIEFRFEGDRFHHNLDADYGLFAVWETARPYLTEIRERLATEFEILAETEIVWSDAHFVRNAARLYEGLYLQDEGTRSAAGYRKKIGGNAFVVFVVKDPTPEYTYARSVSGKIEFSNLRIVQTKYALRALVQEKTGSPYAVHSTNSLQEFFFQAPLIFGVDVFLDFVAGRPFKAARLVKDLEGAGGWKSYEELFRVLKYSCNYLVLRGFEELPEHNPAPDLDVLCWSYQRFASAAGAAQNRTMPFKGSVDIAGESVSLDMRFVGDKYYDPAWAQQMLQTKVLRKGVYVPRDDHYFFSLLFHAKVQKPAVKPAYYGILESLAQRLGFDWYATQDLDNDAAMGRLLHGYLMAEGFLYEDPVDRGVHKNAAVIAELPTPIVYSRKQRLKTQIKVRARQVIPEPLVPVVRKILRR